MDEQLYQRAVALAARGYRAFLVADRLSDGTIAYVAMCPELDGCMTHADTDVEAITNLEDARHGYIYHLLEHGFDVPEPALNEKTTRMAGNWIMWLIDGQSNNNPPSDSGSNSG